jgi:hypothetical protein
VQFHPFSKSTKNFYASRLRRGAVFSLNRPNHPDFHREAVTRADHLELPRLPPGITPLLAQIGIIPLQFRAEVVIIEKLFICWIWDVWAAAGDLATCLREEEMP